MHPQAFDYVRRMRDALGLDKPLDIVEIGSRDVNGSVRPVFPHARSYVGVDLAAGPGVDWVGNFRDWGGGECGDGRVVDVVVCTEVLEHYPSWPLLVQHAWRVLRPGGHLILTAAAAPRLPHSAVDGGPLRTREFYGNVDVGALSSQLMWFDWWQIEYERAAGDVRAVARKGA